MVTLMADIPPGVALDLFHGVTPVPKVIPAPCANGTIVGELKDA